MDSKRFVLFFLPFIFAFPSLLFSQMQTIHVDYIRYLSCSLNGGLVGYPENQIVTRFAYSRELLGVLTATGGIHYSKVQNTENPIYSGFIGGGLLTLENRGRAESVMFSAGIGLMPFKKENRSLSFSIQLGYRITEYAETFYTDFIFGLNNEGYLRSTGYYEYGRHSQFITVFDARYNIRFNKKLGIDVGFSIMGDFIGPLPLQTHSRKENDIDLYPSNLTGKIESTRQLLGKEGAMQIFALFMGFSYHF